MGSAAIRAWCAQVRLFVCTSVTAWEERYGSERCISKRAGGYPFQLILVLCCTSPAAMAIDVDVASNSRICFSPSGLWQPYCCSTAIHPFSRSRKRWCRPHAAEFSCNQNRLATPFGAWMSPFCTETSASSS